MKDFSRVAQLSAEEAIRLVLTKEKESEQTRWSKFDAELTKRVADLTEKHQAELQKHQTEKHELTVRLEESDKNASAAMQNAKQHERLTTEKELQPHLAALNGRVMELEAAQTLADERRQAEVTKVKAELDAALNIANAKANDLDRRVKDGFRSFWISSEVETLAEIRLGTSSFTAAGWEGSFYPKGIKSADRLSFYAEHFETVEIDSTFYACPSPRTVEGWALKTPEDFIFLVKDSAGRHPRKVVGRLRRQPKAVR
jgi:hypothetical protein